MNDKFPVFALTITGSAEFLARILSLSGNGDAVVSAQVSAPQQPALPGIPANGGEDDENGPTNLTAPATDSAGIPWDDRIHSKNKAVNASDGTWRKKRGVNDAIVSAVEAELKANMPQTQQTPPPPYDPTQFAAAGTVTPITQSVAPPPYDPTQFAAQQPPAPQVQQQPPAPQVQQQPPAPPAPQPAPQHVQPGPLAQQAAVQQPAPPAQSGLDFNGFMGHIQRGMQTPGPDGKPMINPEYLQELCAKIGAGYQRPPLSNIMEMTGNPAMIAYAIQIMQADGRFAQ